MKNKKLHIWVALAAIVLFVCLAVFGCGEDIKGIRDMRFGIDIRGGVEAVFEPSGLKTKPTEEQLEMAREIIETRLDAQNILDREVTVDEKAGDVIVRFPWKSDEKDFNPEEAIQELGEMAELTFRGSDNTVYIKGSDISRSQVGLDEQKRYVVELEFSSEGAKKFAEATEKLVGQNMGIYMDEELISNPTVNAKITGGKAEITGMSSKEEAQSLSDKINSGALPFSMETTNYSTISPTLGGKALNAMALAAEIAMILICLFMICWYRLPGVISCLTLAFQIALQVLVISVPQYTITLPGIAGLILSAGMAVDANIIISERISEELKKGNSVRTAVKNGYKRAFSSVLDGNITTAAVAGILMIFGSGTMLSFGYTLLTGVIINLLAGVWMSRYMLNSVIRYKFFNKEKWFRRKKEKKILKFAEAKRYFFLASLAMLIVGTIWSSVNGIKLDTQFTGGVILRYTYSKEADTGEIQKKVEEIVDRSVNVQTSEDSATGEKNLVITLSGKNGLTPDQQKEILTAINEGNDNQFETSETSAVEPYIGAKALKNSAIAIVLSFLFIVVYIRLRFSALGGLASGVTAVIALLHDILIVLFVFGIFRIPVNDAFVAVTLTIIGYSINDTIVLYDRIREHRNGVKQKNTLAELVDISTTETLQRSINTAFTVVLCAAIILIVSVVYGMESITNFSLPLLAGLVSGCYSSICIAGPLWVWREEHKERIQKKKTGRKEK